MTARYANVEQKWGDIAALDIEADACDTVFIHFVLHDIPARTRPETVRHLFHPQNAAVEEGHGCHARRNIVQWGTASPIGTTAPARPDSFRESKPWRIQSCPS
jgi:hypothetical protein